MNGVMSRAPRSAWTNPGRSEWAMTASSTALRAVPSRAPSQRSGMRFDDAARALPVEDAHDDRAGLGAGELRDHRDTEATDPKRHGDQESVGLFGEVVIGCRRRENLEPGERVRVKPRAMPRVEPVGDDVFGLACAHQPGDRRLGGRRRVAVGRIGVSVGVSPPMLSSRTHASTPSSNAGCGRQVQTRPPSNRSPCQGQISVPHSIRPVDSSAPR